LTTGLTNLSLPSEQVDLFLDAESIALMPGESSGEDQLLAELSEALQVGERFRFRNVIFTGSSVPENLRGQEDGGKPLTFTRTEFRVWKQYVSRPGASLVRFGDTGVWNPRQPFRGEPTGYRGLCQKALKHPGVRDLPRCWGLDSIRRAGRGYGGADNATGWVARDTNLHIETTVQQVQRFLQSRNRLSEMVLAPVRSEPWQQETWTEALDEDA
jgi:hypothetical protein